MIKRKGSASGVVISVIIAAIAVVGGGIFIYNNVHSSKTVKANAATVENKSEAFTITDSTGQKVHFDKVPQKIVVLDADAYSLINMLGGKDKVVGVSKMMSETPGMPKVAVAGTWQNPNVEEILKLKADVVFAYAQYTNKKAVKELQDAGVKVVYINADNMSTLESDVTAVGQILGNESKAQEFNDMATKYINLVKERISKIPADKRVNTYIEEYGKDQTAGKGSAVQSLLDAAGVKNIAANDGQFATVSDAWILQENPDMVIKLETDGMGVLGQGVTNTDKAEKAYDELIGRPGWDNLKAVKEKKVYLMDNNLALSDMSMIPGMLYIAKWAYPEQFKDINPAQVQKQIDTQFLGKTESGTYVYNGNK